MSHGVTHGSWQHSCIAQLRDCVARSWSSEPVVTLGIAALFGTSQTTTPGFGSGNRPVCPDDRGEIPGSTWYINSTNTWHSLATWCILLFTGPLGDINPESFITPLFILFLFIRLASTCSPAAHAFEPCQFPCSFQEKVNLSTWRTLVNDPSKKERAHNTNIQTWSNL